MTDLLTIGRLARDAGCAAETIRHYERLGLVPAPARSAGGQRRYGRRHAERLAFIRHGRELGFSLPQIASLVALTERRDASCAPADRLAREHLRAVEARIRRLEALRDELARMVAACDGGTASACRILQVVADHSHAHCLAADHGEALADGVAAR